MIDWGPTGFLTAGGKQLEYASFGPAPDATATLVLLHEGLGCTALWRDFPERLAKATGLGVFVYSRAGYGGSDSADLPRPLDYMTREAVDVLPEVLDAAGIQKAVLLGHSDGATISAVYAGTASDLRVQSVILIAPHFFTEQEGLDEIARAKVAYETTDLPQKMARYHRNPDNAFYGWNEAWLDPGFRGWNVADALDTISVPLLAIQGEEDQYGTLAQIDEITTRCSALVRTCILPDTRHSPHLESSDAVIKAVSGFCIELEA